jgi:hypothetical protein
VRLGKELSRWLIVRFGSSPVPVTKCALEEKSCDLCREFIFRIKANSEQGMRYASVAHVDFGRLNQPLPDISVPGPQPANNQEIDKEVEIAGDRLAIDSQPRARLAAFRICPWLCASIVQKRRSVSAGMRDPN